MQLRLIDDDVVRAVDGPQLQLLAVLELHRRVHVFGVELSVAALPIEVESRHVGSANVEVAPRELLVDDEPLELTADRGAVGQPQWQAWPDSIVDREKLEILAELLVVPLLGLFEELQVFVELPGRLPGRAVDARQLRLLLIAAPVRTRDAK